MAYKKESSIWKCLENYLKNKSKEDLKIRMVKVHNYETFKHKNIFSSEIAWNRSKFAVNNVYEDNMVNY